MKRRTADASKVRRPIRRSRITDSVHGSWLLYVRFFIVWLLVISLDFLLEFRFEFLWPLWLLLRSTYDSFRYQGMGLTFLFLTVTVCSDLLFFVLLPIHWLFFAASTYVWVQFVWNTDRGPCLPTVFLWLLFVYVEASVRLRELKPLPFHLDLCRPFAAHCIGYPVVSLGYGFKSYIGFKLRQYKQEDVSKENQFYTDLISYSLPTDIRISRAAVKASDEASVASSRRNFSFLTANGDVETPPGASQRTGRTIKFLENKDGGSDDKNRASVMSHDQENGHAGGTKRNGLYHNNSSSADSNEPGIFRSFFNGTRLSRANRDVNTGGRSTASNRSRSDGEEELMSDSEGSTASGSVKSVVDFSPKSLQRDSRPSENFQARFKEEQMLRRRFEQQIGQMEADAKRCKQDLHGMRQADTELRSQLNSVAAHERFLKSEVARIKSDNESLQQKLASVGTQRQQDKSAIASLERKLKNERDARSASDAQLKEWRKRTKETESQVASQQIRENHDACIAKRQELQQDINSMQIKVQDSERRMRDLEKETDALKKKSTEIPDSEKLKKETEYLYSALTVIQGKNTHLENSLSAETRLKLDLFSALGDTRRQLEITQAQLMSKDQELKAMKAKVAEVMAVMPPHSYASDTQLPVTSRYGGPMANNDAVNSSHCYSPTSNNQPLAVSSGATTKNGMMS